MKIERINDSQIRCTLSNFDLSERNLNLSELAYGSEKARVLFREMVQKAYDEVGFDAEDIPIMVEAIPMSNESIVLVITKVDDPEEVDTRFARFAPSPEGELMGFRDFGPDSGLEGAGGFTPLRDPSGEERIPEKLRVYSFESLDRVIEAAAAVAESAEAAKTDSSLYKTPEGDFRLVLSGPGSAPEAFSALCNRLSEYGSRLPENYSSASYCEEHYEPILKQKALTSLAKI